MAYKPGDFFIGVIDFFGILVPGAVLLYLQGKSLVQLVGLKLPDDQAAQWVAFAVGSYVLGNFLLWFGAPLDCLLRLYCPEHKDSLYNKVKDILSICR